MGQKPITHGFSSINCPATLLAHKRAFSRPTTGGPQQLSWNWLWAIRPTCQCRLPRATLVPGSESVQSCPFPPPPPVSLLLLPVFPSPLLSSAPLRPPGSPIRRGIDPLRFAQAPSSADKTWILAGAWLDSSALAAKPWRPRTPPTPPSPPPPARTGKLSGSDAPCHHPRALFPSFPTA